MKAMWAVIVMAFAAAALSPVAVDASNRIAEQATAGVVSSAHNDLLTGLMIALGCALFSAVLRRLPHG